MENTQRDDSYSSPQAMKTKQDYVLSDGTDLSQFLDESDRRNMGALLEEDEDDGGFKHILYTVIVLLVVGGFSVLAWYAYKFGSRPVAIDQLQVVEADGTPYKTKPDNPGGMEVPYQDKVVYDSISDKDKNLPAVERILPAPEEPVDLREEQYQEVVDKAKQETDATTKEVAVQPADTTETADVNKFFAPERALEPVSGEKDMPAVQEGPEKTEPEPVKETKAGPVKLELKKKEELKPVSEQDLKTVPKESKLHETSVPAKPAADGGRYRIQLGAYRSEDAAAADWKRLQKKFPGDLTRLNYTVERKDLGAKGIFYRLQAGPLESSDSARLVCKKLIEQQQGCFFVEVK